MQDGGPGQLVEEGGGAPQSPPTSVVDIGHAFVVGPSFVLLSTLSVFFFEG